MLRWWSGPSSGVDCVFHQAALPSVPRSMESPLDTHAACVTGTVTLLDAARRAGVRRVVYASSSSVYGDQPASSKRESDLPAPISPYGAAKLAAEYYCRAFAASFPLETVSIRYFNVFGPHQDPNSPYSAVIPLFITAILSGGQPVIYGDGLQSRDFTFVANVVHGNLLAADVPGVSGRVFNVAMGGSIDLLCLLASLNRLLGTEVKPIHADPRPGDIRESMADITMARRDLGYEPRVDSRRGFPGRSSITAGWRKGGRDWGLGIRDWGGGGFALVSSGFAASSLPESTGSESPLCRRDRRN